MHARTRPQARSWDSTSTSGTAGYAALDIGESSKFGASYGDSYGGSLNEEEFEALFRQMLKEYLKTLKI